MSKKEAATTKAIRSPAAVAAVAADLECEPSKVTAEDRGRYIRGQGCHRVVFFFKGAKNEWQRAGPRVELSPEDEAPVELDGILEPPAPLSTPSPTLPFRRALGMTSWQTEVEASCILRTDGLLYHCVVLSHQDSFGDAVAEVLPDFRYRPASINGTPIPVEKVVVVRFQVKKPDCAAQSSAMLRAECERGVQAIPERAPQ